MIDTNKMHYSGEFSGFGNDKPRTTFSASFAGASIVAGSYRGPIRATLALNNSDDISEVSVQFTGIDTPWRVVNGALFVNYPKTDSLVIQYQIEVFCYYLGGLLYVDAYISNQIGSTVTVPAFTLNCAATAYLIPTRSGR